MKMISSFTHELIYNKIVKKIYTRYMNRCIEIVHESDSKLLVVYEYNLKYFNFLFPEKINSTHIINEL